MLQEDKLGPDMFYPPLTSTGMNEDSLNAAGPQASPIGSWDRKCTAQRMSLALSHCMRGEINVSICRRMDP